MQLLLMSLVMNGAEAVGHTGGTVIVATRTEDLDEVKARTLSGAGDLTPGKYVILEVRDTGCGMDEATKAQMFDPFFTTKFIGRGLGLAAVQGIVRAHNGGIRVSSKLAEGSVFQVFLPVSAGERPHWSTAGTDRRA